MNTRSDCHKDFLSVQNKSDDHPEHAAPHGLGQLGGVRPHVPDDEVEGEEVVADTVAAVEKDAVHPGVEERLTLPLLLDVNDDVEDGEEEEGEAGCDQHEGDGPEIFVQRHRALILRGEGEEGGQRARDGRPDGPPDQPGGVGGADLEDVARLVPQPHLEHAGQRPEYSLRVEGPGAVHSLGGGIAVNVINSEEHLKLFCTKRPVGTHSVVVTLSM